MSEDRTLTTPWMTSVAGFTVAARATIGAAGIRVPPCLFFPCVLSGLWKAVSHSRCKGKGFREDRRARCNHRFPNVSNEREDLPSGRSNILLVHSDGRDDSFEGDSTVGLA